MEGTSVVRWQRCAMQRIRRRSKASKSTAPGLRIGRLARVKRAIERVPGGPRSERDHRRRAERVSRRAGWERQEGNGRSDAVRLSTRGNLRRVRTHRRETGSRPIPPSGGVRSDPEKRGEPQVRHRAATCSGPAVGESRRGGGKPRGRNATSWVASTVRRTATRSSSRSGRSRARRMRGLRGRIPGEERATATARCAALSLRVGNAEGETKARRRSVGSIKRSGGRPE